jgi:hypothetical protein
MVWLLKMGFLAIQVWYLFLLGEFLSWFHHVHGFDGSCVPTFFFLEFQIT